MSKALFGHPVREAFPDTVLSKSQEYEWHKKFLNSWTCIEDDPHSGCPKTSTKDDSPDQILQIVKSSQRLSYSTIEKTSIRTPINVSVKKVDTSQVVLIRSTRSATINT